MASNVRLSPRGPSAQHPAITSSLSYSGKLFPCSSTNSTFCHVECAEWGYRAVAPRDTDLNFELTITATKMVTDSSHVELKATTQYVLALKDV